MYLVQLFCLVYKSHFRKLIFSHFLKSHFSRWFKADGARERDNMEYIVQKHLNCSDPHILLVLLVVGNSH